MAAFSESCGYAGVYVLSRIMSEVNEGQSGYDGEEDDPCSNENRNGHVGK